ncbi:hypothetical protein HDU88_001793 [Geranomyces variabilis]|nr:hypothetical protein HDU88_001793 [Geranomyces variabilis]
MPKNINPIERTAVGGRTGAKDAPDGLRISCLPAPVQICDQLQPGARREYYSPGKHYRTADILIPTKGEVEARAGRPHASRDPDMPRPQSCPPPFHNDDRDRFSETLIKFHEFKSTSLSNVRMPRAGPGYDKLLKLGWTPGEAIGYDKGRQVDAAQDTSRPTRQCQLEELAEFVDRARDNNDKWAAELPCGHLDDAYEAA